MTMIQWRHERGEGYEGVAETTFQPIYPYLIKDLEEALGKPVRDLHVLELGGGPGHMAVQLLAAGVATLVECDICYDMLARCRRRVDEAESGGSARLSLCQSDAGRLPLADHSCDVIFSRGSIMFWNDLPQALHEMYRVLRPDGLAYFGGGTGRHTPAHVRSGILEKQRARRIGPGGGSGVPKIDPGPLEQTIAGIGGSLTVHSGDFGIWFQWHRQKREKSA